MMLDSKKSTQNVINALQTKYGWRVDKGAFQYLVEEVFIEAYRALKEDAQVTTAEGNGKIT